jgi:primosomal protein N' (replication factor Y)
LEWATLPYAEVSVNSPIARRQTFSYSIPGNLSVDIGQAVWVPFGSKVLQGIVLELSQRPSVEQTREIIDVIGDSPLLSPARVKLAQWLSDYYLCPPFDAVAPLLPPGFERKTLTFVSITSTTDNYDLSSLTPPQLQVIEATRKHGRINLGQLEKSLGKKRASTTISQLASRGLIERRYQLEPVRIKPKQEKFLILALDTAMAKLETASLRSRAIRQASLLDLIIKSGPISRAEALKDPGCQAGTVRALEKKGLIKIQSKEVKRQPIDYSDIKPTSPLKLATKQKEVVEAINKSLWQCEPTTFLLHGVTGSGKTEVYLQVLAELLKTGKQGIVLVPEISLTPQTIERFAGRFQHKVAVIHSRLSLGEQFDQWRQIRDGRFDIVIGARSAIFAPLSNLGLLIIDEEHEWSYKQDTSPRYHARTVGLKLAEISRAVVVLGSATPDVGTYYHAQKGDYKLVELPQRITPREGSRLPQVELVDMKDELKAGNRSIFSRSLKTAIEKAVNNKEQVILFFNRRGAATFIQCRSCGKVLHCRRCQVSLKYHSVEEVLVCHQCNNRLAVPQLCPHCHMRRLKFLGAGTQKLESEAGLTFPGARILRWDSDAISSRYSHRKILDNFRKHKADILIGTQMVARGLDIPRITLVGVVSADTGLNLPDFRAGERSFQLVSQVAGRAGRGALGGRVIIQTFYPRHYAIKAALKHDYASFYNEEIAYRRQLRNPPFSQIVRLTYSHTNDILCHREAERMKRQLTTEIETTGTGGISLVGPAPAFIQRVRGRFRWQIIVRGFRVVTFLSRVDISQGWVVDVDPLGLV